MRDNASYETEEDQNVKKDMESNEDSPDSSESILVKIIGDVVNIVIRSQVSSNWFSH